MGQIRLAIVGKSKQANTWVARYLYYKHKFVFLGLDDELDKFLRKITSSKRPHKPAFSWQRRQQFYDAWQVLEPQMFVKRAVDLANNKTRHIVIPDARYLDEVKVLEEAGFTFIRVTFPPGKYRSNSIKILDGKTNKGAIGYYEWFAADVNAYVKAKYAVHLENPDTARSTIDLIYKKLTEEQTKP